MRVRPRLLQTAVLALAGGEKMTAFKAQIFNKKAAYERPLLLHPKASFAA